MGNKVPKESAVDGYKSSSDIVMNTYTKQTILDFSVTHAYSTELEQSLK